MMTERLESGDRCPACNGLIGVLNTRPVGSDRIQWLGCRECGFRPEDNKRVIPLRFAPRRRRRRAA